MRSWFGTFAFAFLALSMGQVGPTPAQAAVIDFSATGRDDLVKCASVANVSYCDENKFDYGWYADYILLSDYDFGGRLDLRADQGTYFTPLSIDNIGSGSALERAFCNAFCREYLAEPHADTDKYYFNYPQEFLPYETPWLTIEAFRDGQQVASRLLDPDGLDTLEFGSDFADISRLTIDLAFSYFEVSVLEPDGYIYTCFSSQYSDCFGIGLDNFTFTSDVAAIPLPATGWLLGLSLVGLGFSVRSRSLSATVS